jgi:hypothetical protein
MLCIDENSTLRLEMEFWYMAKRDAKGDLVVVLLGGHVPVSSSRGGWPLCTRR